MADAYVVVGAGVQVIPVAIIQTGARVADYSIVNTGGIVDRDGDLGAHTHSAPGRP